MFEIIYRYDPARPNQRRAPDNAADALQRLEEGNRTFVNLAKGTPEGSRVVVRAPANREEFRDLAAQVANSALCVDSSTFRSLSQARGNETFCPGNQGCLHQVTTIRQGNFGGYAR